MSPREQDRATAAAVHRLVEPVLERMGYELVLVEFGRERPGMVLRLYIDRDGGVGLEDCERVSREVSAVLDVEDLIDGPFHLEVSSPGVNRPLTRERDFERFKGEQAKVVTLEPRDGRKTFKGRLEGVEQGEVVITVDGQEYRIPLGAIARANLVYQF